MSHNDEIKALIHHAKKIVVFSGAGFSTESNIPDFRSEDGIYKQKQKYPYSAEVMLSHSFFMNHTESFYEFYKKEMVYPNAKPNRGHKAIAKLEEKGKLCAIITQNIDGLHQLAGNTKVLELHGNIHRNYCMKCHKSFSLSHIMKSNGIPTCDECGGVIKPDVVLYEEGLNQDILFKAIDALQTSDLLIVAGTSLVVYPAAGLLQYFGGKDMILINREPTSADHKASVVSRGNIGDVLDFVNHE